MLRNKIYMLGNDTENDDAIKKQTINSRCFCVLYIINLRIVRVTLRYVTLRVLSDNIMN